MQKKIIVLAIAAALTAPAMALAEATVYGQANVSIDMVKTGETATAANPIANDSANQLNSNNSRVGFKGSEDLGGGMSAIWQMEGTVSMDTPVGNPLEFDRNTFVGLMSNSLGTLRLGNYDTPYNRATRKLDVFGDTVVADNRGLNGVGMMGSIGNTVSGLEARAQNAIDYTSPNFSGFSVALASVFGAETLPQPAAPANKKGTANSLAAMYSMDAIYATLALVNTKVGDAGTGDLGEDIFAGGGVFVVDDKISATKLGVGYTMDAITANLVFEKPKVTFKAGGDISSTNIYLAGKYNVSASDAVKLAYTKAGETTSAGVGQKDSATQIALGYDHGMGKNTTVYALYTKTTLKAAPPAKDTTPSTISVGLKHSF